VNSLLPGLFAAAVIGGLASIGLADLPPVLEGQDTANCQAQQQLPGIPAVRQAHCTEAR
jgi:hypothetical protein